MSEPVTFLEALPAPGEPLKPLIDEQNAKLLEAEIMRRREAMGGKLKPRAYKRAKTRWQKLTKLLEKAGYYTLIAERDRVWDAYLNAKRQLRRAHNPVSIEALQRTFDALGRRGRALNRRIAKHQPRADEVESLRRVISAHDKAVEFEREDEENRKAFMAEAYTWEAQIKAVFRQSARLHHTGVDSDGKSFTVIPQIEHIIVKDDKVLYQIKTTHQTLLGRWFNRWDSALPYNVDVSDLICDETLENLRAATNRIVTVERSKRGANLFYAISRLDSPDGIPQRVAYRKVMDFYPVKDHAKTPWAAGVGEDRKVVWYNFEDYPHVLIAGSTKSGKSNHVNQMIASMVTMHSPAELRLMLVDLKGGIEFTHWQGLKHHLRPMVKKTEDVLDGLRYLRAIMEQRLALFERAKAKNLERYNSKNKRLSRIVCIVDEMATLIGLGDLTNDIHTELRVLSSQGRAVGIHLVLATQHSSVEVLPGWIKTNMGLRISGKMPTMSASQVILDSNTASTLPNIAGRLVYSAGRWEIICQSPYISDDEIADAVAISQRYADPDNSEFDKSDNYQPPATFRRDELLQIAVNEFEGKLSPTRIFDYLGKKVAEREIRRLVDEIVLSAANGLEWRGTNYELYKIGKSYAIRPIGQTIGQELSV